MLILGWAGVGGVGWGGQSRILIPVNSYIEVSSKKQCELVSLYVGFTRLILIRLLLCPRTVLI